MRIDDMIRAARPVEQDGWARSVAGTSVLNRVLRDLPSSPAVHLPERPPWRRRTAVTAGLTGLACAIALAAVALPDEPTVAPENPPLRPASANELLDRAAQTAERSNEIDPRPDQFIVRESYSMYPVEGFGEDQTGQLTQYYLSRSKSTQWRSVDGSQHGAVRQESLAPRQIPGFPLPAAATTNVGTVTEYQIRECRHADNQPTITYAHLSTLDVDPARMLEYLQSSPALSRDGTSSPARSAIEGARAMLRDSYVPAAQRAAVYRALKLLPEIVLIPDAEDAAGRHGMAIGLVDGAYRTDLIFDPTSYRYLGQRQFVVAAVHGEAAPVGTQVAGTAELQVSVSDTAPQFPERSVRPPGC